MVERSDGRGILAGDYLNQNRELTRQDWLEDCFPEWGTLLNQELEAFEVKKGQVAIWWLGGPSWILKTDQGGIFFIDVYSAHPIIPSFITAACASRQALRALTG